MRQERAFFCRGCEARVERPHYNRRLTEAVDRHGKLVSVITMDPHPVCPVCGEIVSAIPRNTLNRILWDENLKRIGEYIRAGKLVPEV